MKEVIHSPRASPVFSLIVLVTLGLAGLNGLMILLIQLRPGFLGMAHFTELSHRVHDFTYAFIFGAAVVGMLAQLRRPLKNVAGMLMALIPWTGMLLAAVLSAEARVMLSADRMPAAVLTLSAALLHPAGRDFFRSFSVTRVNWILLSLVIAAAVPLLVFASTNVALQRTSSNDHAALGHYGFMAAFGFTVVGIGLLASLRPDGWRLPARVAGVLPALLGVTSIVFPDIDSSLGLAWALAAVAWGVVFVAMAELDRDGALDTVRSTGRELETEARSRSITTTPRWVTLFGIITIALALVFAIMHLIGGPPKIHTP